MPEVLALASGQAPTDPRALDEELAMIRMLMGRGDIPGAHALCRRVLDENPRSGAVMVAMGDIASADAAWAEAVSWYERALEVEFSPDLMQRLAEARNRAARGATVAPSEPRTPSGESQPTPVVGPAVGGGTQSRQKARDRQTLGIVIAAFLVVTLAAALLVRSATNNGSRGSSVPRPRASTSAPPVTPSVPAPQPAAQGGAYVAAPAGAGAAQTPPPVSHTGRQPTPAPPSAPPAVITTSREHQLLNRMRMEKWSDGTRVPGTASMASDPYAGQAIVTLHAPRTADVWSFEADILTAAYRVAASALRNDPDLQTVVVRCIGRALTEDGQDEDVAVFRAAVPRARISDWLNRNELPSFEQMNQQIFEGVWWDKEAEARVLERFAQRGAARAEDEEEM